MKKLPRLVVKVKKFGGTSLGTIERMREVAAKVAQRREEGENIVVVVSAMAGETNRLLGLAKEAAQNPKEREVAVLLSTGEMVSSALFVMILNDMQCNAESFTLQQLGIRTDGIHTRARISSIEASAILRAVAGGKVAVVAGFQGVDALGDIMTFDRGGSDLTAVALAAALRAELCEIYTDVDGVFTANPSIVSTARLLKHLSYEEMLEMASLGAKVLQTRSVALAKLYNVPLVVKHAHNDGEGTLIAQEDPMFERLDVTGVTLDAEQTRVTFLGVPDQPGVAEHIFRPLKDAQIVVDMIVQNVSAQGLIDLSFSIARSDEEEVLTLARTLLPEIGARTVLASRIAKVSLVGTGMRSSSGVAWTMFAALAHEGINILMIHTSEITISVAVAEQEGIRAVQAVHDAFQLGLDTR